MSLKCAHNSNKEVDILFIEIGHQTAEILALNSEYILPLPWGTNIFLF